MSQHGQCDYEPMCGRKERPQDTFFTVCKDCCAIGIVDSVV